jgi:hypothetical protein
MSITKDVKAELGRRVATATEQSFLEATFRAYFPPETGGNGDTAEPTGDGWSTRVVQLDSTGAATVEIRRPGGAVFAKFFPPGTEGRAIYEKLLTLRENGFGADSAYRVVEPVGYVAELDLLICREAEGPSVADVLATGDHEAALGAVREAATWLGRLHATPVRIGAPHSLIVSTEILSVTRRLAKVAADRPDYVAEAVSMIERLETLAIDTVDGLAVQSHGQYRPIHVFLGGGATTVIDLDRSRPADPARDTAEFLHRLRRQQLGTGRGEAAADEATAAFLDAYREAVPDASAWTANLRFHWARYVFHSMNRKLKKGSTEADEQAVEAYRRDFAALVDGGLLT